MDYLNESDLNNQTLVFGNLDKKNRIFHNQGKENDVWTIKANKGNNSDWWCKSTTDATQS